jgi:hypothetical protein
MDRWILSHLTALYQPRRLIDVELCEGMTAFGSLKITCEEKVVTFVTVVTVFAWMARGTTETLNSDSRCTVRDVNWASLAADQKAHSLSQVSLCGRLTDKHFTLLNYYITMVFRLWLAVP